MALEAIITADNLREAGIAASLAADTNALPEPSVYFQDFTFGASMFEALFGNAEALSGVGEGVADVATDNRINQETNGKKSTDLALDVQDMIDAEEARRAEIIKLGELNMTRGEMEDILKVLNDPEQRERASQDYAARNNVSIEEGRSEMNWMHRVMSLAEKQANGTITASEQAELNRETSRSGFEVRLETAKTSSVNVQNNADISLADDAALVVNAEPEIAVEAATQGSVIEQNAVAAQIDDNQTWESARSAQGFADRELGELADRRNINGGDELASMFGEVADPVQVAAVEATAPTVGAETNPAPMRG